MKRSIKNVLTLLLVLAMFSGLFLLPAMAAEQNILNVKANYSSGKVSISGETKADVLAVGMLLYQGETLLRLETTGVSQEKFSATIAITLSPGIFTVKVANYEGGPFNETSFTVTAPSPPEEEEDNPYPPTGGTTIPVSPAYSANDGAGNSLLVSVNTTTKSASVSLKTLVENLRQGVDTVITIPSIEGMNAYSANIPASALSGSGTNSLSLKTAIGDIKIPDNMLLGAGLKGNAKITFSKGDISALPDNIKETIGNHPIIQLSLAIDGQQVEWNNPDAPITISIPYIPTEEELANQECIIIWYIDGSGKIITIPNGHYDASAGTVTFRTTHFSDYAVVYNKVNFKDVTDAAWYFDAVSFIGAREITKGTGNGNFNPQATLMRGEFIVLVMRAYNISPDTNPANNFSDAGNAYYTDYLAAAKRLGITAGIGNNLYAPNKDITRQEMFTLLYNTLKAIKQLPQGDSGKALSDFSDAGLIDTWAKEAIAFLVQTGVVTGSSDQLAPLNTTTRAEMAQVIYNLLGK